MEIIISKNIPHQLCSIKMLHLCRMLYPAFVFTATLKFLYF